MLHICEIKKSMNGEINQFHQGSPAIFVRFQGCNFHQNPCSFCDTPKALPIIKKEAVSPKSLFQEIKEEAQGRVVVLTGGEPLIQDANSLLELIHYLYWDGFDIVVETNGSISPAVLIQNFPKINIVIDFKSPSSEHFSDMNLFNFLCLRPTDIIKFPVLTDVDMEAAVLIKDKIGKDIATFAVSPVILKTKTTEEVLTKAKKILEQAINNGFTFSLQLHKLLNVY
jgi:organic radical activating enzyme